jgi:hypothetical protein
LNDNEIEIFKDFKDITDLAKKFQLPGTGSSKDSSTSTIELINTKIQELE